VKERTKKKEKEKARSLFSVSFVQKSKKKCLHYNKGNRSLFEFLVWQSHSRHSSPPHMRFLFKGTEG
jgi:hypothetical protein